ncbi:MAG: polysaccharide biosynthesis protein [bacterium]
MSKRIFDLAFSLIGITFTIPFYFICAVLIKLESKGPILFKQIRIGKDRKLFTIYKFRTMFFDQNSNGIKVTSAKDSRITKVGHWLRKYKLDELPQLFNVLKGDMSLVGPRPEVPEYVKHYNQKEQLVFSVRPGITDLASIYYRDEAELIPANNPEDYYVRQILHEKLKLNLNYICSQSFWYDLKILAFTILISFFPAFNGKWLRSSLQSGFFNKFSRSALLRLHRMDKLIRGKKRILLKFLVDSTIILVVYYFAFLVRYEGQVPYTVWLGFVSTSPILISISIAVFYFSNIYRGLWEYCGIKELLRLINVHTLAWVSFISCTILLKIYWVPRSVLVIYWLLGLVSLGGVRIGYRIFCRHTGLLISKKVRVLIVGAGDAGEMILRQIINDPLLGYQPVGLVDDDAKKLHARIHGVPIVGTTTEIPVLARDKQVDQIIIATPSATASQMRRIVSRCQETGIDFKTVPGPRELIDGKVTVNQLRDVKIEDLLEREPVHTDSQRIASFLRGEVVMVTGAGGSIGQELCQQILQYKPKNLIMFDHSENSLFYLDNDLRSQWSGFYTIVVGDVCDEAKVGQVLSSYKPSIVFHAAAHKHVPLMELNPEEAIKNNLRGTMMVATLAKEHGVGHFVLISTDKAVEPTNIMGVSKRLAELYVQAISCDSTTGFVTVRFGNVLGSNGSVVTLFQKQIERGGPVTVTDPRMTRYFMTISEAVTLILQASAIGEGGEIFVLDMGEPIKVVDMARHLITLSGLKPDLDIPIEFIGRRPGEKIFEQLWHDGEIPEPTDFDKILVARTNGHDNWYLSQELDEILELAENMQREELFEKIQGLIPSYQPGENGVVVS